MIIKHFAVYRAMAISLGIMLILAFWPIAADFRYYRPDWLSLWLVFWALHYPQKLGVWLACIVGLVWDLTTGSLLGSYALSSAIVVYATRRLGRNVAMFNIVEKAVLVIFLVVLALAVRLALWLMVDLCVLESKRTLFKCFIRDNISLAIGVRCLSTKSASRVIKRFLCCIWLPRHHVAKNYCSKLV
jgi:rod shape-determining protein MreD